ncbi:hypothetical protein EYF80_053716 [Liparis tanakae]|uniref:Uncharacterized protein n=1 Tax=Liparis tanakae TaxID=230148 RepID=A0A4Z2F5I8_9TELE|nr:hypothetical protein EYF80_053716 [Liparis tanakae]
MSSVKPPTGSRHVPVTNCSSRILFSLSISFTTCSSMVFFCQSVMSISCIPQSISWKKHEVQHLLLVEVAQPLQRNHLVEAVQEGFGLLLHAAREPPVRQQAEGKEAVSVSRFSAMERRVLRRTHPMYSSLFSSVTSSFSPSSFSWWVETFPRISMSWAK